MPHSLSVLTSTVLLTLGLAGCHASESPATAATPASVPAAAQSVAATNAPPASAAASNALQPSVAVQVGGEPELDPCMTARVKSEGSHDVLAGPDQAQPRLASLAAGQIVHVCDPGGEHWFAGIVWHEDDSVDCGISSPIAERAAYAGSCHTGWISVAALEELAG